MDSYFQKEYAEFCKLARENGWENPKEVPKNEGNMEIKIDPELYKDGRYRAQLEETSRLLKSNSIDDAITYMAHLSAMPTSYLSTKHKTGKMFSKTEAIKLDQINKAEVRKRKSVLEQRKAEEKRMMKKEKEAKRKAMEWKFTAPHQKAIDPNEIALTLSREYPIAFVEQKTLNGFAFVVIHSSIVSKALTLGVVGMPEFTQVHCGHYVVKVNNKTEMGPIYKWVKKINAMSWKIRSKTETEVTVKYPKL